MKRAKFVIKCLDGEIEAWGNGYEVTATGVLSIIQVKKIENQYVPLPVFSLGAGLWQSIHEVEHGIASYQSQGNIMAASALGVQ